MGKEMLKKKKSERRKDYLGNVLVNAINQWTAIMLLLLLIIINNVMIVQCTVCDLYSCKDNYVHGLQQGFSENLSIEIYIIKRKKRGREIQQRYKPTPLGHGYRRGS